ncbi:uncharacterized protein L199_002301 [Kwoniella botswanensis]|uniref:uncharacterized protein n=1 Tax=Kwoniella botswanensis TaxID=1268659 RepID=UPI00315DE3BC
MSSLGTSASTHTQAVSTSGSGFFSRGDSVTSGSGMSAGSARKKRKFEQYETRGGEHDSGFASEVEEEDDATKEQGETKRYK